MSRRTLLPPSRREFRDIYIIFELMESDLHQVIKANDELSPEHPQFFFYPLLRGMRYRQAANVFRRGLQPLDASHHHPFPVLLGGCQHHGSRALRLRVLGKSQLLG